MKNLKLWGMGALLVAGFLFVSCGDNALEDSGANPEIAQAADSGYSTASSAQLYEIPDVKTIITSKPPANECTEFNDLAFTCDRERTCKNLPFKLPAFLKPFCKCTYECKFISSGISDQLPGGLGATITAKPEWESCTSPVTVTMPEACLQATFQVRATDALGLTDPSPAKYSWQHCCIR